jgi:NADH-quinone oxidoreductase subunit I
MSILTLMKLVHFLQSVRAGLPENLIVVTSVRTEQTRGKDLTTFTYDLSRCMFRGVCEDACPVDALELTQDFELASYTREGGIWNRQMLEEGLRPTQYA